MRQQDSFGTTAVWLAAFVGILMGGGSVKADFVFGEPVNLGPTINTSSGDTPSFFSPDGLEMYFDSNRSSGHGGWDIWVTTRETDNDGWGAPVNLGSPVNTARHDAGTYISADGLEFYFQCYNRSGGYGGWDIWITTRATEEDAWDIPQNLGPLVNSSEWEGMPWLSADGLELYFYARNRASGYGDYDIWVSRRVTKDDPWREPTNLGSIVNSSACEIGPALSPDGLLLFFSEDIVGPIRSGGFGGSDMWVSRRASASALWGKPTNLGSIVNSPSHDCGPRPSPDGATLYFSSERPGGFGGSYGDIYEAPIIAIVDFNGDGKVDGTEILAMANRWGTSDSVCDIGTFAWGDGIVDVEDLKVLAEYIGKPLDDPTLVAHWPLDEADGFVAADCAGDCDGVLLKPLWQPDAGHVGGALELDGASMVMAPLVVDPAIGPFSVLAWVKGGSPGQVIISQKAGANWLLLDPATGALMTELKSGGRSGTVLYSDAIIADGTWHRVAFAWDGSTRSLYVDDVLVAEDAQNELASSFGGLNIGAGHNMAPDTYWTGLIDDVRIYNRAVRP